MPSVNPSIWAYQKRRRNAIEQENGRLMTTLFQRLNESGVFSELEHFGQHRQWPRTPFNKKTTRINKACALSPPKVSSIRSTERESYILHFLEISARFLLE
ncbi:uncharacterized protein LOC112326852 [Populus trichocarpa]|uniref:Uncharacterized protein n=1 Tax=Populus trichocarpa TaxID=3694 RepID=A0A3N7ELD8_POPTR|nr:uncharacterized protein LOC112326852 [Populus trichocarpa]